MFIHAWKSISLIITTVLILSACKLQVDRGVTPSPTETPTAPPIQTFLPTVPTEQQPVSAPGAIWTFQTGASIWGSAALDSGAVFFGSDDGNLYALETKDGRLLWKFATRGIVRSQPAIGGGRVYFASDDGGLYAVDEETGAESWRTEIGDFMPRDQRDALGTSTDPTGWDYRQSSPVIAHDKVYVGSLDGNVYALDAADGKILWTFKTGQKVRANPMVDQGTVYIGSWDKSLYALDALTGKMRWGTALGGQVQSTALVADGLVYCASRKASVVALDTQDGKLEWENDYGQNMWVESSPQIYNGVVYIGSSGGKLVKGLDEQTGKVLTGFSSNDFMWSTPQIVDGMLYIGGTSYKDDVNQGGLFALKLADGKITSFDQPWWYFPVQKTMEAEGNWTGVASSATIAEGRLYFGGLDGVFYAVSIK
jgi:outer membrane protein assembly factor BamB